MKAEKKKLLLMIVKDARAIGIEEIKIEFSGSGDSGGIESTMITAPELVDKKKQKKFDDFMLKYEQEINDCGYDLLNDTSCDFNNDGSQGVITLDCTAGTFIADVEINYMSSNSETAEVKLGKIIEKE